MLLLSFVATEQRGFGKNRGYMGLAILSLAAAILGTTGPDAHASTWNTTTDWSTVQNPIGDWSYGRKWSAASDGFDIFPDRWHNVSAGGTGWYLGGTQWSPSVMDTSEAWPNDNLNGIPAIRWTAPSDGAYDIDAIFTGADSRGVSVYTYVVLDGTIQWSDRIDGYLDTTTMSLDNVSLQTGQHIDFVAEWTGSGSAVWNWTSIDATIRTAQGTVPVPGAIPLAALGTSLILGLRRRRFL